jgi:hypothetical protein
MAEKQRLQEAEQGLAGEVPMAAAAASAAAAGSGAGAGSGAAR